MDRALLAIVFSFLLILLATLVGYYEGEGWDTISDMITRSPRLRNAFALFVGLSIVCQYYYCSQMIQRWQKLQRKAMHVQETIINASMAICFGGAIGFAINSTDIATDEHMFFAAVSFSGAWLYMTVFCLLGVEHGACYVVSREGGIILYFMMTISAIALAAQPSWKHYAEYVFVISLHAAALCFYVVNNGAMPYPMTAAAPPHIPVGPMALHPVPTLPGPVEFMSVERQGMQRLRYNGTALTWSAYNELFNNYSDELIGSVKSLVWDGSTLTGIGQDGTTATGNPTVEQYQKIRTLAQFYRVTIQNHTLENASLMF